MDGGLWRNPDVLRVDCFCRHLFMELKKGLLNDINLDDKDLSGFSLRDRASPSDVVDHIRVVRFHIPENLSPVERRHIFHEAVASSCSGHSEPLRVAGDRMDMAAHRLQGRHSQTTIAGNCSLYSDRRGRMGLALATSIGPVSDPRVACLGIPMGSRISSG